MTHPRGQIKRSHEEITRPGGARTDALTGPFQSLKLTPCGSPVTGLAVSELRQVAQAREEDFKGRPYLRIAAKYRAQIKGDILLPGMLLPSVKRIAADEQVSPTTAHRAISVLAEEGLISVRRGARAVVTPVNH